LWIPDKTAIWRLATILERNEDTGMVTVELASSSPYSDENEDNSDEEDRRGRWGGTTTFEMGNGLTEIRQVKVCDTHAFDPSHADDLEDAAKLNMLHEAPLFNLLIKRFKQVGISMYACCWACLCYI
jgi:hypothetical protein